MIKDFSDQVVCQADLGPLDRLGLRYELLFNERGGLDLVTLKGRELRVNHTDSESLAVDARRWGMLARQQESAEMETVQRQEDQRRQDEERTRRQEDRSRELAQALGPEARARDLAETLRSESPSTEVELAPSPPPAAPPAAPTGSTGRGLAEVEAELEKLRMSYVSGAIQRTEYRHRAEALKAEIALVATSHVGESAPEGLPESAAPPPVPVLHVEPISYDAPLPARTPPARPIWSGMEGPRARELDLHDFERRKVERLLEALEERLARNEISEATYRELKTRYLKRQSQA